MSSSIAGTLHIYIAFDWGEEILLDKAIALVPASKQELPRRRRTPSSLSYRLAPLHVPLDPVVFELPEMGPVRADAAATLFDFAAVSLDLCVPFNLTVDQLKNLAAALADPSQLVQHARAAIEPLQRQLASAIVDAKWADMSEEYFVFQFAPDAVDVERDGGWLAGLVYLENGPLSQPEIAEALRLQLRYGPRDVFIPDWGAAVLTDEHCEETLLVIEFANLQLLEFRHIDNRLDESIAAAARTLGRYGGRRFRSGAGAAMPGPCGSWAS